MSPFMFETHMLPESNFGSDIDVSVPGTQVRCKGSKDVYIRGNQYSPNYGTDASNLPKKRVGNAKYTTLCAKLGELLYCDKIGLGPMGVENLAISLYLNSSRSLTELSRDNFVGFSREIAKRMSSRLSDPGSVGQNPRIDCFWQAQTVTRR